jgi:hypothetical protein
MNKIILTSLFALSLSGAALAQATTDNPFASVDTDGSGGISYTEAQVLWPDLTQEAFDAADIDEDDVLSENEYLALAAANTAAQPAG